MPFIQHQLNYNPSAWQELYRYTQLLKQQDPEDPQYDRELYHVKRIFLDITRLVTEEDVAFVRELLTHG